MSISRVRRTGAAMPENVELSPPLSRNILAKEAIPTKLLSLLKGKNVVEIGRILKNRSFYADHFYDDPHEGTLLHIACRSKGNHEIVKILLAHGADINLINEIRGSTPIHEAIENNDIKTFDVLLNSGKCNLNLDDRSELRLTPAMKAAYLFRADMLRKLLEASPTAAGKSSARRKISGHELESSKVLPRSTSVVDSMDQGTVLLSLFHGILDAKDVPNETADNQKGDDEYKRDFRKCLDHILDKTPRSQLKVNSRDRDGNTALHYAVKLNDQQTVLRLLNAGSYLCNENHAGEVLLKSINPKTLEEYLNSCISTNAQSPIRPNYQIIFNCEILKPPENHAFIPEIEPLLELNKVPELRSFLEHPVLHSFLTAKWHLTKKLYHLNVLFCLAFCLTFASYIYYNQSSSSKTSNDGLNSTLNQSTQISASGDLFNNAYPGHNNQSSSSNISHDIFTCTLNLLRSVHNDVIKYLLRILILILCGIRVLREFLQICISIRKYFSSPENWLEILLIIAAIDSRVSTFNPEQGAAVLLASSIKLALLVGQHPKLTINTEIFKTATSNFLKFLSCYSILILALAFICNILKIDGDVNTDDKISLHYHLSYTLLNSIVMIKKLVENVVWSDLGLTDLLSLLNVFFIAIVPFSLFNRLTDDIHVIRQKSRLNDIVSKMNFVWYVDVLSGVNFGPVIRLAKYIVGFCYRYSGKLQCCQNLSHRRRYRARYIKLLSIRSRLFPDVLHDGKIRVFPNRNMAALLVDDLTTSSQKSSVCRMDENIVKRATEILEKRKPIKKGRTVPRRRVWNGRRRSSGRFVEETGELRSLNIKKELKYVYAAIDELPKSQSQRATVSPEINSEPADGIPDTVSDSANE